MNESVADKGEELQQAKRECMVRERWRFFCLGHSIVGHLRRERGVKTIDR